MKARSNLIYSPKTLIVAATLTCGLLTSGVYAAEQAKQDPAAASQSKQKTFATSKEAADALIQAAESFNVAALKEILGPDSDDIISSEDPVQDKNRARAFCAKGEGKNRSRNRQEQRQPRHSDHRQ
jgi:hypothetical protein